MKKTLCATAIISCMSTGLSAEEYITFMNLGHSNVDIGDQSYSTNYVMIDYNFVSQETIGPLDQFDFINTTSYVYGGLFESEGTNAYTFGGAYYAGPLIIGGSFANAEGSSSQKSLSLGYLINSDFVVNVSANDDEFGTDYTLSTAYTHRLSGNDYVGFSYATDEEFDYHSFGVSSLAALANGQFIHAQLNVNHFDGDSNWNIGGSFYFNHASSVGVSVDDDSDFTFSGQHHFTKNIALQASIGESDFADMFNLNLTVKF
jgi:hypothetical protein